MDTHDSADLALRDAVLAWQDGAHAAGAAYTRWSEPGGYELRAGTLGLPDADFVVWIAATAGSGILGNAAYDGLRSLISRLRTRGRHLVPSPQLRRDEVVFMARLAVKVAQIHYGLDAGEDVEIMSVTWNGGEQGDWLVKARAGADGFEFLVSDGAPETAMFFGRRTLWHDA
jgi:hypothetical protein